MLNVIYKEIEGFENLYWVTNAGEIWNGRKRLKTWVNNAGYECIKFKVNGKSYHKLVHRLVAEAFIENPENKTEVNHIDGSKLNNNVWNLEWVTSSENKRHAIDTGLKDYNLPTLGIKKGKTSRYANVTWDKARNKWVACIRVNGKTLGQKRFDSEEEAALHVNKLLDEFNIQDRLRNVVNN